MSNPINDSSPPAAPQARLVRLSDALAELRADADAAHQARVTNTPRGPITRLKKLDLELGGAFAPGINIIHGGPGTGKTAFTLQTASSCQCPSLFVSCEMSIAELLRRHTARITRQFLGRLKSGEMTGADAEAYARKAIEAAPLMNFIDATQAPASPTLIYKAAQVVKGEHQHLLVIVDSLHSWAEAQTGAGQEYELLNAGIASLQKLAHTLKCPVLVVSERNRDSMKTGGINAGAGTRKIEYCAETVIDLDRSAEAKEDGDGEVDVKLRLVKNRHGAAGKPICLKFNGALQQFSEA